MKAPAYDRMGFGYSEVRRVTRERAVFLTLDPDVRCASSIWHVLPEAVAERGLEQLRRDLVGGEWDRRYGDLRDRPSLDIGLRLVISELGEPR